MPDIVTLRSCIIAEENYTKLYPDNIYLGDCLDLMKRIKTESIDMILCDLPYGTTACKWDIILPFEPLWEQYKRVIRKNRAIVLFGSEPFSSLLRLSNLGWFKYDWIWNKRLAGNALNAKHQPLKIHEIISIFGKGSVPYNPIKTKGKYRTKMFSKRVQSDLHNTVPPMEEYSNDEYYPISIQEFSIGNLRTGRLHPTQKPVELCEYLIKTYTNEGDTILDNCIGSGTTAIACINTGRHFIGIEKNREYYETACRRILDA